MSIRLAVSVEGLTEERFVKAILAPHLEDFNVDAIPIIVTTSRSASGKKAKGGGINLDRVVSELQPLLHSFNFVTSMYDFYGFGGKTNGETVGQLEGRIALSLGEPPTLVSYVQQYEFEALLLSNAAKTASYFQAPILKTLIDAVVSVAGSPEHVNDSAHTAPSKRLEFWTHKHAPHTRR